MNANQSQSGIIALSTKFDTLGFDSATARLVSFRANTSPGMEMIASAPEHPTFVVRYLDERREFRDVSSLEAESVRVEHRREDERSATIAAHYSNIGGLGLDVEFSVHTDTSERFSRWRLTVDNRAGLEIVHVDFPFVVCACDLGRASSETVLVLPHGYGTGQALRNPSFKDDVVGVPDAAGASGPKLGLDTPSAWDDSLTKGNNHYPGLHFAQFLACHNEEAGLYLACEDTEGGVKVFNALHREPGMRLAVAHVGDWPKSGTRRLDYDIVLGSFVGDWYAAADIYREWTLAQPWGTPLHKRTDVPEWLLDSPVYITVHPEWDDHGPGGPANPVMPCDAFVPFDRQLPPLLERIADAVEAPLAVIMMGWERAGSWVCPDSYPWAGGDESVARFVTYARRKGWRTGTFCSGTRWATGHINGYDGREYYERHGGERSVCRTPGGSPVIEDWDAGWRPSYECCLGTESTRRIAAQSVRHLVSWGMESLQFFDQNNGASTFPCYALDHGHPSVPGRWMAEGMERVIAEFAQVCETRKDLQVVQSAEAGVNEYCLPLFQLTEFRLIPPGHQGPGWSMAEEIPLYQYLFHECIVIQGMMGFGQEPYHVPIANAANAVMGSIPGGVLKGNGTLQDQDTMTFAPWGPVVGNDADGLEMIRTVTALRRGPGRDFLVLGRMQKPGRVRDVQTVRWSDGKREHSVPAVFHALWQAPDGRLGVVLANWTTEAQTVTIEDDRLPAEVFCHVSGRRLTSVSMSGRPGERTLAMEPLSCALVEFGAVQV